MAKIEKITSSCDLQDPAFGEDATSVTSRSDYDESSCSRNCYEMYDDIQSTPEKGAASDESFTCEKERASDDSVAYEKESQLALRETRAVIRLRLLVILVLLLAATAVSVVVYFITRNAEIDEFLTQYEGASQKIVEAFQGIVSQKLGAISSVGVAAIAHGVDHSRTWPFVTLSSFQQRSSTARSLSKALFVGINPFILESERSEWEKYVHEDEAYSWIPEGFAYQEALGLSGFEHFSQKVCTVLNSTEATCALNGEFHNEMFYVNSNDEAASEEGPGPYMAVWQTSPVLHGWINQNLFKNPWFSSGARRCLQSESVVIGGLDRAPPGNSTHPHRMTAFYATLQSFAAHEPVSYHGDPMSTVYLPIFSSFETTRTPVAVMIAVINWASYFRNILPPNAGSKGIRGVVAVLDNSCDAPYTYEINGEEVNPLGPGDLHNPKFDYLEKNASFRGLLNIADGTKSGLDLNQEFCPYTLKVYPSEHYYYSVKTNTPIRITFAVAMIFAATAFIFLCYDYLVEQRQRLVLTKANRSTAIVSSLFPKNVRDRLMEETGSDDGDSTLLGPNNRLRSFLTSDPAKQKELSMQPIADLFPHTTVLFADIAGFTAWSSTRDPAQVFILLQSVYQAFDVLAKKHKVFKVETIGDSYVAVTGLPDPQDKHAVIMARFAGDCLMKMNEISKQLEVTLGPDTGDLTMRFGLNSGPVTAGVLRGERARFQLFGDTVNTAARMESTGIRNRIQVSQATAELLIGSGKSHWIRPRKEKVQAKGKGLLSTYWLQPVSKRRSSASSSQSSTSENRFLSRLDQSSFNNDSSLDVKRGRHVDWICELLQENIRKILKRRRKMSNSSDMSSSSDLVFYPKEGTTALDEVAEVICLPKFNPETASKAGDHHSIEINPIVSSQLREYVSTIAAGYHGNPFHNFEHACHVTMSVSKLLKRIVAPDLELDLACRPHNFELASHIHDYTHGINSDPLAVLAIMFSAIIHDIDHRGVSNVQLIKEEKGMADLYKNKSVAEQNSFDIAWNLLMSEQFKELRNCIFANQAELLRFRQVMVNVVMATDIFDKELNDLRKARWEKAFEEEDDHSGAGDKNDVKATIVIEHIIQASDVSHTMQHWHVYTKWNARLFQELFLAYRAGRMQTDPTTFWYQGELAFFDNYIIPLARKLKDCKIFGVSSDEYLNYALQNRAEWEDRGMEIVEQMKQEFTDNNLEPLTPGSGVFPLVQSSSTSFREKDATKSSSSPKDATILE